MPIWGPFSRPIDIPKQRRLFSYADINGDPVESTHAALSPYLVDASGLANPALVVDRASNPLNGLPKVRVGTKPVDGGHYLFSDDSRGDFLKLEPSAAGLLLPFLGAREFLQGEDRWILWVHGVAPQVLRSMPQVMERIATVRQYRSAADGSLARQLASSPTDFHVTLKPDSAYLALPEVSSSRREYLPIGWLEPPTVPSNQLIVLEHAQLWHFAILCSRMHNAWQQEIGGKLKSDFRYAPGLVYNTFPMPPTLDTAELEGFATAILEARIAHAGATLSDLYDPLSMPANLRKAHLALDKSVDQLYRRQPFSSDRERVEHLLSLYEKVVAPLTAGRRSKRMSTAGAAKIRA